MADDRAGKFPAQGRRESGKKPMTSGQALDIGYLVYATFPPTTDAAGRPQPSPPGGSKIVAAKDTGETVTVPNYPNDKAIALYRRQHQPNA